MARSMLLLAILGLAIISMGHCNETKRYKLSSGYEMPAVGLGTGSLKDPEMAEKTVLSALESGYRLIDAAYVYGNEKGVGRALKKWFARGNKREDVFITSKLPFWGNWASEVEKYVTRSLKALELDYIDLYLIHAPLPLVPNEDDTGYQMVDGKPIYDDSFDVHALWKAMEREVEQGRVRSLGMSNCNSSLVKEIYQNARIKPTNLQVETHGYFQQKPLRRFAKDYNIVVTGYAPIGSPGYQEKPLEGVPRLLENPIVLELAKKHEKSPAQILLRHGVQGGLVVIPKSSNPKRIKENIDIFDFELSAEEMTRLDTMDQGPKGRIYDYGNFYPGLVDTPYYMFAAPETYPN